MKKKIIKIVTVISLVCTLVAAMVIPSFAASDNTLHDVAFSKTELHKIWGKNSVGSPTYFSIDGISQYNPQMTNNGITFTTPDLLGYDYYTYWFGAVGHYFYGQTITNFRFEVQRPNMPIPTLTFQLYPMDGSSPVYLGRLDYKTGGASDNELVIDTMQASGREARYPLTELARLGYTNIMIESYEFEFNIDVVNPVRSQMIVRLGVIANDSRFTEEFIFPLEIAAKQLSVGSRYTLRCYVANMGEVSTDTVFTLNRYAYHCDKQYYTQTEYDDAYAKGLADKANELQAEINGYLAQISGLNTDLATKEAEILGLRGRITELEEQIAQGGADDGSYDEGYAAGKADAQADAATEIQRLEKRIATLEGEITDLEEAKKGYQELVEEKNAALEEAQKNHEELIAEKDTEIGNLITENESLSNNNEWLGKENTRLEDENDRQGFEITRLNGVIENLEAEIERLMKEGGDVVGSLFEGIFDGISNLIHPFLEIEFVGFRLSTMIAAVLLILLVVFVLKIIV